MLLPFQGADTRSLFPQGVALGYVQAGLSARPIATGGCAVGRGNLAHRLYASRIENGLKAQKHPAQGKRSDTLGNAHPASCFALKGQKHSYGLRCVILWRCIYAFALSGRRYTLVVPPGRCPGLCAGWAFSPPHCNGRLRCGARQFGASAACVAYRERAESPKAPSPGQAKRHPGYAYPASCHALKGQKHKNGERQTRQ